MDQYLSQYLGMVQEAGKEDREWSAAQAEKQMQFQKEMSDTAHQREVEDLKKAGLNPVLSAGGSGAAVTTGASAQSNGMTIEAMYGLVSKAFQAQIDQAEAIQTTAKGVGGYTGSVTPTGTDDTKQTAIDAISQFVQRKTGIKPETTKKIIEKVGSISETPVGKALEEYNPYNPKTYVKIGKKIVDRIKESVEEAKDYFKFKFGKKG